MLYTFVHTRVAVLVRHWFEIGLVNGRLEHGARIELRLLEPQPHRGSESAAQKFVIDRPVWRADLFDRLDRPAGTFSAGHYHPRFDGNEPCDRVWDRALTADPWAWAVAQLSDVGALCEAAGVPRSEVAADVDDVRDQAAQIVDVARSLAPANCTSPQICHRWTRDVADAVDLMLDQLPDEVPFDREYAAPWLAGRQVSGTA